MIANTSLGDLSQDDVLRHRPRLLGLAYRMLGDMDEAEDVVQEGYFRWYRADQHDVRSAEAWLVTVVSRLAVDRLRRLRTERTNYPGTWLPEPIATDGVLAPSELPPTDRKAELASDLSVALLVILERLTPDERVAFLLREVFGTEYGQIATILEKRPDAVRQMVHRARERVRAERPAIAPAPEVSQQLLERFLAALAADDASAMMEVMAPDVVFTSDGGGRAATVPNQVIGQDRVARLFLGVSRKFGQGLEHRVAWLNGQPALLTFEEGAVVGATTFDVEEGRVRAIYSMRNPDKLRHVLEAASPIA
jgi:RNA polymerase sigma-70 factor (ECF subfamily)